VFVDCVTWLPLLPFVSGCVSGPEMVSTTWLLSDSEHANLSAALLLSIVLADVLEFCKLLSWL
jgi:hypothetical protein